MSAETAYERVSRIAKERKVSFNEAIRVLDAEGALTDGECTQLSTPPRPGKSQAEDRPKDDPSELRMPGPDDQPPRGDRVAQYARSKDLTVYEAAEALFFFGDLERAAYERYRRQAIEAGEAVTPPSVEDVSSGRATPVDWSERWPPHPEYPEEYAAREREYAARQQEEYAAWQRGQEPPAEPEKL